MDHIEEFEQDHMDGHVHEHTHMHTHADGTTHSHPHEHAHAHPHDEEHDHEHSEAHAHEHTHEHDHGHTHSHEHSHDHDHGHTHSHGDGAPADKVKAILSYMVDHNEHHAEELEGLMSALPEHVQKKMAAAIGTFDAANVQLREVLEELG